MGSYFSNPAPIPAPVPSLPASSSPEPGSGFRGLIIEIATERSSATGVEKIFVLAIPSDDPKDLYDKFSQHPYNFILRYGYSLGARVKSVQVCGEKDSDLDLMYRIASHLKLDTTGVQNHDQLKALISDHLKYAPPPEHTGYYEAKESFMRISAVSGQDSANL